MRREKLRVTLPAVIALGSNLGDREATLRQAIAEINQLDGVVVDEVSSFYETDALKPEGVDLDAPSYINAVILVRSALKPHELLDALQVIEQAHDRVRLERWGDRTLDLDIVTFAGLEQHDDTLTLPHPRAFERAFVLAPWYEIQPGADLPGRGAIGPLLAATYESPRLIARWTP
ncbi:2-amino-4-hydroxy-6-hydroxymethyldihydropteridine diphosphokinase [Subtercola boreus]|uniref:2-amino-4-hydroxy-6-hydroxymethyldihydropteridine diphosphokinase n=1 Tax=Subtercola boreus TaxID=120213 RepID=A0A3E0W9R3_9MICO|nr:2-amino-4-hydroxy-6-hydroxymethyldihydropteridine diphosphokinase [Subtercola boreus]RFA18258.1 2-amino-4-hydroxy-6-hydroxymethyldihydropteridine diphosphokinase [Subtercola boreus]RFA18650.1 2-amino-4-hydroxy-6-hydroxymethyldihydropteridine diphosphokinase [Subtercola boreus]RFA25253.1 2-amino-4-hydroxy-6-hydroxymethyldihydropteridine diphosphokinase [Subtercola boreus]